MTLLCEDDEQYPQQQMQLIHVLYNERKIINTQKKKCILNAKKLLSESYIAKFHILDILSACSGPLKLSSIVVRMYVTHYAIRISL